ncbi:hypothetical protein DL93DRAFT_1136119 [Clavulina sp. PMI_390]|nr:hypothetical protein DL93DRAFT_1136119 [Clavulina sp. PMI_390]
MPFDPRRAASTKRRAGGNRGGSSLTTKPIPGATNPPASLVNAKAATAAIPSGGDDKPWRASRPSSDSTTHSHLDDPASGSEPYDERDQEDEEEYDDDEEFEEQGYPSVGTPTHPDPYSGRREGERWIPPMRATPQVVQVVMRRDGYQCVLCGDQGEIEENPLEVVKVGWHETYEGEFQEERCKRWLKATRSISVDFSASDPMNLMTRMSALPSESYLVF